MMTIDTLVVRIETALGGGGYPRSLGIKVKVGGQLFSTTRVVDPDDFRSHFDKIFDQAKQVLRYALEHPEQLQVEPWTEETL